MIKSIAGNNTKHLNGYLFIWLLSFALILLTVCNQTSAQTVTIGSGTGTEYGIPMDSYYDYGWSSVILLQSEIATANMNITQIKFYNDPNSGITTNIQKIYMAHTTASTFADGSKPNENLMTLVYSGNITWNSTGWQTITLDNPFLYNNTDNLQIYYENRDGSYTTRATWRYTSTSPNYRAIYNYNDGSFPTSAGTRTYIRPNIQLVYTVACGINAGTASGATTICSGATASLSLSGQSGGTTLQWQQSSDNSTWSGVTGGSGAATSSYTTPALSSNTYYRCAVTNGCTSYSNSQLITVSAPSAAGTASGTTTICSGNTTVLSLSGYTGSIQWQQSADGVSGWTNVTGGSGATTASYTTATLSATTYYRAMVTSGACSSAVSSVLTVSVLSGTITTFPYTQDFGAGASHNITTLPCGWSNSRETGSDVDWKLNHGNEYENWPTGDHTGNTNGYDAYMFDNNTADDKTKLISPAFDFTGYTSATLKFWIYAHAYTGQDVLTVYYKTSAGGSWIPLSIYFSDLTSWTECSTNLPELSSTYYIAFEGNAKYGYSICLDDISINTSTTNEETIFTQNFENSWSGSPSVPAGWTAIASGTAGTTVWQRNVWTGAAWSLGGTVIPKNPIIMGAADQFTNGAVNGVACAYYKNSGANVGETDMITTGNLNLSSTIRPNLRFYLSRTETGHTFEVKASKDGGATWATISGSSNIRPLAGSGLTPEEWQLENIEIPLEYRVSNARIGFSITSNGASGKDIWIDNVTIEDLGSAASQCFDGVTAPAIPAGWTVENTNGGATWKSEDLSATWQHISDKNVMWCPTVSTANDWLFTPGMNLAAGNTYTYTFVYFSTGRTYVEELEVYWGDDHTSAAMTSSKATTRRIYQDETFNDMWYPRLGTLTITPAATGTYYIGFHAYGTGDGVVLDNMKGYNTESTLPVELTSFNASCDPDNEQINLNWSTASETNNDFFTIEKSLDALNYEIVATIPGAGNSNELLNYEYADLGSMSGNIYYRLKQTDFDGHFEYFNPEVVNCSNPNETAAMTVHPNPASSECYIDLGNMKGTEVTVTIVNNIGQTVFSGIYFPETDWFSWSINIENLSPGVYFVNASSHSSSLKTQRLVIQ